MRLLGDLRVGIRTLVVLLLLPFQLTAQQPANADSLWSAMLSCSSLPVQTGGNLTDVHWQTDPVRLNSIHARAEWIPPDTILLSTNAKDWEIAHELLHHLARGPIDTFATGPKFHPMNPFYFPCKVMPIQNHD